MFVSDCIPIDTDRCYCQARPPLDRIASLFPVRERVDAVHRTHRQALVTAAAEFGNDHHVNAVVKDGPQLLWAVPQTRIAVNTDRHINKQGWVLPLRIALSQFNALCPRCTHATSVDEGKTNLEYGH